jgi:hypothetical protein
MKKAYQLFFLPAVWMALALPSPAQTRPNALPVLVNVDANLRSDNKVIVTWTMLAKVNTDYFDVEKSNDGVSWKSIATVKADDNAVIPTSYSVLDAFPLKGSNFYQVRIKDLNGNITFTVIKNVRVNASGGISLYPNPSTNQLNISLGEFPPADWSVSIINNLGQLMVQKKYSKNITVVSLPVYNYPEGNYIVQVAAGSSKQSNNLMITHK